MKELSAKVEADGKTEETLYEKFVCWGQGVINSKKASNSESQARVEELTTYIADIDAGRIEFTSERVDLEKDLEELNSDIEAATELRAKEKADFDAASEEMDKTIAALEEALTVLKEATADHKTGTLLALRGTVGFSARVAAADRLSYAVDLGAKFLTKGDAVFLRRVLTGGAEVPEWDWKKLNREATFKKSYKARSFKIQEVLAKLLQTFQGSKADAVTKETDAVETYDKLMATKSELKGSAEEALLKLEKENGVKGMSRSEAEEENELLKEQISDDEKYIQQVEASLAEKKEEWKDRTVLRAGELEAISKAISILSSDDARDLFKKSITSQGYSFLQTAQASARRSAADTLRNAAAGDRRISALGRRVAATPSHFDAVVKAIDDMVATLSSEEATELAKKEGCEKDRMDDTRSAAKSSRTMDELTEAILSLKAEIKQLEADIVEKEEDVKKTEEALSEATRIREDEATAYAAAKKDDEDAAKLVASAKEVLEQFYADNNLMLVQQSPFGEAGKAPPPPPKTWEAPYGGKTGESTGIISTLALIHEDINKDIAKATAEEEKSIAEYTAFKTDSEKKIFELKELISSLNADKAEAESDVVQNTEDRTSEHGSLKATMKKIKSAEPDCDYFTINYPVRTKNRQIEVDGLHKAKATLQGGEFATPEDPTRELKPGDAFLQRVRRH
jgi:hypothetical protein